MPRALGKSLGGARFLKRGTPVFSTLRRCITAAATNKITTAHVHCEDRVLTCTPTFAAPWGVPLSLCVCVCRSLPPSLSLSLALPPSRPISLCGYPPPPHPHPTPPLAELIPSLGALSPRGGPVQDQLLTAPTPCRGPFSTDSEKRRHPG